jgi:hypothetical protein
MMTDQCIKCIHYTGSMQCDAFPKEIPDPIWTGEYDHTEPYPGDHGIQFEPIDEAEPEP